MIETIVYKFGGAELVGYYPIKRLAFWLRTGKELGQKFLYKGYKRSALGNKQVVVYDTQQWDDKEIARRKDNGFLGIKEYRLEA